MESRKFKIISCILIILVLISGICWYLFRNSDRIYPDEEISLPQKTVYFSQKNPDWSEDTLGNSKYKMADSGCLVTCLACALNMQNISSVTPKELNQLLSEHNGYDADGNLQWSALEQVTDTNIVFDEADISGLLHDGIYPVVRVRMHGIGSYHYVLIIGSQDGTFLCADPMNDSEQPVSLSEYGNRIYAVRFIAKEVKNPDQ